MTAAPNAKARRILLVDDDPNIRDVFGEALRDRGHTVNTAANHDDAAELLEPTTPPDLLITDIDLGPGKSGLDLAHHAQTKFPLLPILLMSGHHTSPTQAPLLHKPIRLADLLASVSTLLHEGGGADGEK
jgi:DNA-binding NtrC family response regulator